MRKLVLASASPRRRELLSKIGLKFDIVPSKYDEKLDSDDFTYEKIEKIALCKAQDIMDKVSKDAIIISADTVVVLDGKILGKPHSKQDAFDMISALSGKTHEVITAIAMIDMKNEKTICRSQSTKVKFRKIETAEIEYYVSTEEPYDKAGAYAAQGLAAIFVEKIDGCFNNVVGISVYEVAQMLKELGYGLSK